MKNINLFKSNNIPGMVINLLMAGFFGATIPLFLKKMDIDPAIGSTVILTTVTDVVGFFSFLGLATYILI